MMNLIRRNPVGEMTAMQNRINRMFNSPYWLTGRMYDDTDMGRWNPAVDLYEKDDHFVIKAELPGVDKKDVSIEFKNDTLTIKGEKKAAVSDKEPVKDGYIKQEISYGKFERSWIVKNVEQDQAAAKHENGVLTLTLPKNEKAKNIVRQIEIR